MSGALSLIRKLGPSLRQKYYSIASEFSDKLPSRDRELLKNFVDQESGAHSSVINAALRANKPLYEPELLRYIDNILKKAPRASEEFPVYRGAPMIRRPQKEPGYTSVTMDRDVAKGYADDYNEMLDYPEDYDFSPTIPGRARMNELILGPRTPLVNPDVTNLWDDSELLLPRDLLLYPELNTRSTFRTRLPHGFKRGGLARVCNCA